MAFDAGGVFGHAGKTAVFPEIVAALTAVFDHLDVHRMIEVDRLMLLGIEQLGENNPADRETSHKPDNEKQGHDAGDGAALFLIVV